MDGMIWAILLQQQAQQAEARRRQEEAAAQAKAEADAKAAAEAQAQRQAQIAQQRQTEAAQAQQDEQARLAGVAGRAGPIAPTDSYSPVGGSFFGSAQSKSSGGVVDQGGGDTGGVNGFNSGAFFQPGKTGAAQQGAQGKSALGDMFGDAYSAPKGGDKQGGKNASFGSGGGSPSYSIF